MGSNVRKCNLKRNLFNILSIRICLQIFPHIQKRQPQFVCRKLFSKLQGILLQNELLNIFELHQHHKTHVNKCARFYPKMMAVHNTNLVYFASHIRQCKMLNRKTEETLHEFQLLKKWIHKTTNIDKLAGRLLCYSYNTWLSPMTNHLITKSTVAHFGSLGGVISALHHSFGAIENLISHAKNDAH